MIAIPTPLAKNFDWKWIFFLFILGLSAVAEPSEQIDGLPLYYWRQEKEKLYNFGDCMSVKLVERIIGCPVEIYRKTRLNDKKKLLAIGSIISFAAENDVVWGSGINGKMLDERHYHFTHFAVRAV